MDSPRLNVSERMRSLLSYPKLAGPVPRIFILESDYWLDGACANAAHALGWEWGSARVEIQGVMSKELVGDLLHALVQFRPDFIFTVNLSGMDVDGMFARLFDDLRIPYVTWFVDDPRTIIMGRDCYATDHAIALTWDQAYLDYLRSVGFSETHTMPLAADATLFDAEPGDEWDVPAAFVGHSMVDFCDREWAWFVDHPELADAMHEAFDAGRVTRENFGKGLAALLGPEVCDRLDEEEARHAELVFFIEGTRRLRHELATALVPEGLGLRGDPDWRRSFPNAGDRLDYRTELPGFYRRCAVNLNTTSIQMPNTVNQRVFDCPAAGGFLLTDAQPALAGLFDLETEVASYSNLDECVELLRFYGRNPKARRAVVTKARKRILGEHTYAHRLEQIVEIIRQRFGE